MLIAVFLIIALAALLIVFGVANLRGQSHLQISESFKHDYAKQFNLKLNRTNILDILTSKISFLTERLSKIHYFSNLQSQAQMLRINMDFGRLVLLKTFSTIVFVILVAVLFSPAYVLLGAIVGFFAPDIFVWRKVKAKKDAIERIFPEAIDLLDMCISAGSDFVTAIKWVVEKSETNPLLEQLAIVLSEVQMGKTRIDALKDMSQRIKLPDISSFVRTIILSERMGTSIEEAFSNLSEDTREKRFRSGERYAIKASLKILFPLLFCILPAIMIVVAGPIIIKFTSGELVPKNF